MLSSVLQSGPPIVIEPKSPIQIHYTLDLTFDVPNFDNAPKFDMDSALNGARGGGSLFGDPTHKVESNSKKHEEKLDEILKEFCDPDDEYKFIRWRGHLIVRKR